ncbi:MAG: hypothetical protein KDA25_11500 [Phycisphaerales bacterium]|nr:hypothetical protein [Phycisphaerales bacterium]
MNRSCAVAAVAAALCSGLACADIVDVTINGEVEYNQINQGDFSQVNAGDSAVLTFQVDSNVFTNSGSFPTRGYHIDPASFVLTIGSVVVGLQNPFPGGDTPYFVLRNNDPAVDGFFIADNVDFPTGVPLNQGGAFGQFRNDFSVGYTGDTLSSLDILDAVGTYDYTGLTSFNWAIDDGPFKPLYIIFESMTIVPAPAALAAFAPAGLFLRRRRRA